MNTYAALWGCRVGGGSGTFLWVDPAAGVALAVLSDRRFGDWATEAWPELADAVLREASVR